MRKFAVTTFAVLYAVLIISVSAERANAWAKNETQTLGHRDHLKHSSSVSFGRAQKSELHLLQTKLVETEFAVELPATAASTLLPSERHSRSQREQQTSTSCFRLVSTRAPPAVI